MSDYCNCKHEGRIATLEHQDTNIKERLVEFGNKLDLILININKVAILETNHTHHSDAMGRAFKKIEDIETAQKSFEEFMNQTKGMARLAYILWGALGSCVFMLGIKVLFFMGSHGMTP